MRYDTIHSSDIYPISFGTDTISCHAVRYRHICQISVQFSPMQYEGRAVFKLPLLSQLPNTRKKIIDLTLNVDSRVCPGCEIVEVC